MQIPKIPKIIFENAGHLLEWGCNLLSERGGFSVLAIWQEPEGKKLTKYALATVEESQERFFKEIKALRGVSWYVIAYDVTIDADKNPQRGFLFEVESTEEPKRIFLFSPTRQRPDGKWESHGKYIFAGTEEGVLPPV